MAYRRGVLLVLLAACGGSSHHGGPDGGEDAPPGPVIDASVGRPDADLTMIDAAPLHANCKVTHGTTIGFEPVVSLTGAHDGIPVLVTSPPFDARLFVVMRPGTIRIVKNGALLPEPFLNLSKSDGGTGLVYGGLTGDDERGLLGLAFDPDYARNGKLYVYYTGEPTQAGTEATDIIAEYQVSADNP